MVALWPHGVIMASQGDINGKERSKITLRYPQNVKDEFKRIAQEEGMSENAAIVQALVWALKFRERIHAR